jgi:hypothetical protein
LFKSPGLPAHIRHYVPQGRRGTNRPQNANAYLLPNLVANHAVSKHPPPMQTDIEGAEVQKFPQAIAHRGRVLFFSLLKPSICMAWWLIIGHRFKAQFPENTLTASEGAVKAGAHAIETGELFRPSALLDLGGLTPGNGKYRPSAIPGWYCYDIPCASIFPEHERSH